MLPVLHQSFTEKNLKRIFLEKNSKGAFIEGDYFPDVKKLSRKLTKIKQQIKKHKSRKQTLTINLYESQLKRLYKIKDKIYSERDKKIDLEMKNVSEKISNKQFEISISLGSIIDSKQTYKISNDAESYFSEKKLQINIKNECLTKQASRDEIIPCLTSILGDNFPKLLIRTDISSFFESINHSILNSFVEESSLSTQSKKLIRKILQQYCILSGNDNGLPRGVGVSAYLSELYMKGFDKKIKELEGLYFYQRYVDDIIIVVSKPNLNDGNDILDYIKEELNKIILETNESKTHIINTMSSSNFSIEYLGYKFNKNSSSNVNLSLSGKKITRYRDKINKSIDNYKSSNKTDIDVRLLIDRIRFLTGNTKLTNNKGGAFTGIYNSNKWITDTSPLNGLDHYLISRINSITEPTLKRRLSKFKFYDGFNGKEFRSFSAKRIGEITKVWKL